MSLLLEILFVILKIVVGILILPTVLIIYGLIHDYTSKMPAVPLLLRLLIVKSNGGVEFFRLMMIVCRKFGKRTGIFKLMTIAHPVYVITKPETAEELLTSSKNITKSSFYNFLIPWLGTGLLTSSGTKWHTRRKLLTPTFHFKILSDFLQVFNEQANIMVTRLDGQVSKGGFDMTPFVTLCALDIICETAMGKRIDAQSNSESNYVRAIYRISEIIMTRIKRPLQWPNLLFRLTPMSREHERCLRILHQFTDDVIRERRAELKELHQNEAFSFLRNEIEDDQPEDYSVIKSKRRKRLAFLDLLIQTTSDSESLTDKDIREEVDTFMFEGHDTTAAATNWAIHFLGANPEVQSNLQQEVDQVFGDSNRPVTMDDIKELKYMERVIKESLRLFPSVPLFARNVTDECCIGGYTVPKGSTAVIMTSFIHRDPNHFSDPDRFDPDRWLPESLAAMHPFCFIPFSAGLRNCIGQKFAMIEEKVLLTYIVRKFNITSLQTRKELRPNGELILRPEKGILVQIEGRQNTSAKQTNIL